jgi:predicted  nucleic acid-binding Zn-ribbon protein
MPVDDKWFRDCEARMARVEEQIKGLTPFETVRQMLKPLEQSLDSLKDTLQGLTFNVTSLVAKIEGLADSDRKLTDQHNALMEQRARDEREIHRLEKQKLEEEIERLRKVPRGFVIWVKDKASPITGAIIAVLTIAGILFGLYMWMREHVKP